MTEMGRDGDSKAKAVSDREVRAHILKKLKEALPRIQEAERRKKSAGDR